MAQWDWLDRKNGQIPQIGVNLENTKTEVNDNLTTKTHKKNNMYCGAVDNKYSIVRNAP